MLRDSNWLKSLVITTALGLSGASCPEAPPMENCILGDTALACYDERLDKGDRSYMRPFSEALNYICTNPTDFRAQKEFVERLIRRCKEE